MASEILVKLQTYLGITPDPKLIENSINICFGEHITVECLADGGSVRFSSVIGVAPFNNNERYEFLAKILEKSSRTLLHEDGVSYFDKDTYTVGFTNVYALDAFSENDIYQELIRFVARVEHWQEYVAENRVDKNIPLAYAHPPTFATVI